MLKYIFILVLFSMHSAFAVGNLTIKCELVGTQYNIGQPNDVQLVSKDIKLNSKDGFNANVDRMDFINNEIKVTIDFSVYRNGPFNMKGETGIIMGIETLQSHKQFYHSFGYYPLASPKMSLGIDGNFGGFSTMRLNCKR